MEHERGSKTPERLARLGRRLVVAAAEDPAKVRMALSPRDARFLDGHSRETAREFRESLQHLVATGKSDGPGSRRTGRPLGRGLARADQLCGGAGKLEGMGTRSSPGRADDRSSVGGYCGAKYVSSRGCSTCFDHLSARVIHLPAGARQTGLPRDKPRSRRPSRSGSVPAESSGCDSLPTRIQRPPPLRSLITSPATGSPTSTASAESAASSRLRLPTQ